MRAVFEAQTPIVSAIGHEVDVVLTDLVADLRAPTPTAAAGPGSSTTSPIGPASGASSFTAT